jgi:hypothetical protein
MIIPTQTAETPISRVFHLAAEELDIISIT